ncbi:hypothetical protein [Lactiplantibacillus plantarum]|uniref:hypothetical protein n=1 Tax=Lactiplantibacillus plantarum TaxID=1590 RepID=UPI003F53C513
MKINHKWVLRIMREHDWLCRAFNRQKRKYNSYKGTVGVIAPIDLNDASKQINLTRRWSPILVNLDTATRVKTSESI